MNEDLYNEKHNSSGKNGTGGEDDQLSELEQLGLLLVLDHPHYQYGHTCEKWKWKQNKWK